MRPGDRCAIPLCLLLAAWACSGPAPPEEAASGGTDVAGERAGTAVAGSTADLAALWETCRRDPSRVFDCEPYVRLSHQDPESPRRLAELIAAHPRLWAAHYLAGYLHNWREESRQAEERFSEAVGLARACGDPFGEGLALYGLATALDMAGETQRAEQFVVEALTPARLSGDAKLQKRVVGWLADRREDEGRYHDERPLRLELLTLSAGGRSELGYRKARYKLAENSRCLGLLREAERDFAEVLRLSREAGDAAYESSAGMALGILAVDTLDDRALSLLEEAAAAAARGGFPELEAHAEMLIGMTLIRVGRHEEARSRLLANLARPECAQRRLRFRTLVYLAEAERLCGDAASALQRYERILASSAELDLPEEERDALMGLAALHRDRGDLDAAIDAARRAAALVESMRSSISVFAERTHFLQIRSDTYRILAASLADQDPRDLAGPFEVIERAHARTLRETLSREPDAPIGEETLSLSATQELLGPRDLLVEFLLGERESSLIAIDRRQATFHALPPRRAIESRIEAYREALLRPLTSLDARLSPESDFRRFAQAGHDLFRDLLGPVAERLDAAERLIVVPDRKLHLLPFEALLRRAPTAGLPLEFLGASRAVVYLPAAALLSRPGSPGPQRVVVVSADRAGADLDLAPLRHAAAEARAVAGAYPPGRAVLLEGDDARLDTLIEACSEPVDVLHLTAHAVLDAALGPRVALHAPAGGDAWLDAAALERFPTAPRLAILSACDTAQGELVGGEGILGLVRAFTLAGSPQVVASLWKVDDARTAALMGRLHQGLRLGERPSAALSGARRAMLDAGFEHPFYWAGLVLYGAD